MNSEDKERTGLTEVLIIMAAVAVFGMFLAGWYSNHNVKSSPKPNAVDLHKYVEACYNAHGDLNFHRDERGRLLKISCE